MLTSTPGPNAGSTQALNVTNKSLNLFMSRENHKARLFNLFVETGFFLQSIGSKYGKKKKGHNEDSSIPCKTKFSRD